MIINPSLSHFISLIILEDPNLYGMNTYIHTFHDSFGKIEVVQYGLALKKL